MRSRIAAAMIAAMTGTALADPVLNTNTIDAYRASLLEIAKTRPQDDVRKFILHLAALAAGPVKATGMARMEAIQRVAADESAFLKGIAPYDGWTFDQIMAERP